MSWSFQAVGRASAVIDKARKDLAAIKCSEPEETIKNTALTIVEASLSAMPEASAVKITANGSQSTAYGPDNKPVEGKFTNNFNLTIEPLWGFVE